MYNNTDKQLNPSKNKPIFPVFNYFIFQTRVKLMKIMGKVIKDCVYSAPENSVWGRNIKVCPTQKPQLGGKFSIFFIIQY